MTAYSIRSRQYKLSTVRSHKRALASLDRKRYWISATESLGFSHPDIIQNPTVERRRSVIKRGRVIKKTIPNLKVDLTYKKSQIGRKIFFDKNRKEKKSVSNDSLLV